MGGAAGLARGTLITAKEDVMFEMTHAGMIPERSLRGNELA